MQKTPGITRLIHENWVVVISFALAWPRWTVLLDEQDAVGAGKQLQKSFELAEHRADRALLEMAIQLRALDDEEHLSNIYKKGKREPLGVVVQSDETVTDLYFRDLTNKIMHAAGFHWLLSDPNSPRVICLPHSQETWQRAEVNLLALMRLIGGLGF
jgi:hypothetical protein